MTAGAPLLYLFKSSRRSLYRQQNLHLLAAERGTVAAVSWNRSWVAPDLYEEGGILPGARAVFVLTDRPYLLFVPIREGTIIDAKWDETSLRLRVALGTWMTPAHGDAEAFTRQLRAAHPANVPGERFVMRAALESPAEPCYDEREDEGWRAAIDQVLALSALSEDSGYSRAVFFRVGGVRTDGALQPARREPLPRDRPAELALRFHNPHLDEATLLEHSLRIVTADDALRVRGARQLLRHGESTLSLHAGSAGGAAELSLSVLPDPSQHTQLTLRFPGGAASPLPEEMARRSAADLTQALRRLYEVVARTLRVEPTEELAVLDAFEPVLPGEQRIAERRAVLLWANRREAEAYSLLRSLDPDLMEDEARFLFFRMTARRGAVSAAAGLVAQLDLAAEARLRQLLHELDAIEPPLLDRLVRELMTRVPDESDQQAIVEHVAHRLASPQLIAEIGQRLFLASGDAQRAYSFVEERRRALRESSPEMADILIELARAGASGGDLSQVVSHRIANLIGRGDVDEALARLRRAAQSLPRDERDRLFHRGADLLLERDRHEEAAGLLNDLSRQALETGDIDAASDAIERAMTIAASTGRPIPEWIRSTSGRVSRAVQELDGLREWRTAERERRAEQLRALLLNRRILIVGGLKRPAIAERIAELTGAEIEFGEHFRSEGDSLEALAGRIRQGRYAAVVFRWQLAGHDVSDALKGVCEQAGVPFLYARGGGALGVEQAVAMLVEGARS
jgi:hypothetical protein